MGRLLNWLDAKLIPQWRDSWKFSSVQVVTVFGTLVATYPDLFITFLTLMITHPVARLLAIAGVIAVIALRLWNQQETEDEQTEG
jgi:hypothetical protein